MDNSHENYESKFFFLKIVGIFPFAKMAFSFCSCKEFYAYWFVAFTMWVKMFMIIYNSTKANTFALSFLLSKYWNSSLIILVNLRNFFPKSIFIYLSIIVIIIQSLNIILFCDLTWPTSWVRIPQLPWC